MSAADSGLVSLATDGALLSPIVAGCWRMGDWKLAPRERLHWIQQCVDAGVTSFDHADVYGDYHAEALFGEALALAAPTLRAQVQIVSKCGIRLVSRARPEYRRKSYDTSSAHIRRSVEQSLRNLRVERIDLLLIHRPDSLLDPEEVALCFEALRDEGKVAHFGVSNHSVSQFTLIDRRVMLSTNQVEFSPLQLSPLSDGSFDQAMTLQRRPMIWSPLAGGRIFAGRDERTQRVREALQEVGNAHGLSVAGAAYAWIMRHPSRPLPITGTQRIDEIRLAAAARSVRLSGEEWYQIWEASNGAPVP